MTDSPAKTDANIIVRLWRKHVIEGLGEEETASTVAIGAADPMKIDWKLVGTFVVVAVCMTLLEYFGKSEYYWEYAHPESVGAAAMDQLRMAMARNPTNVPNYYLVDAFLKPVADPNTPDVQLWQLLYWASWCVFTYLVIPAIYVKVVLKQRLRDFGLTAKGTLKHMWVYVLLFLVVLPTVVIVSKDEVFLLQYPFYRAAAQNPEGFWIWELAYAAQFFSLEFFFRGFMIHATKHRLGIYSVLVMVVPYCMIHFGKPMPETFGAIIAGVVLGVLALRTGSIALGFLIHVSVALSMDLVSLWRQEQLGPVIDHLF